MRHALLGIILALLLSSSVISATPTAASQPAKPQPSYSAGSSDVLKGLNGVFVLVEELSKDATEAGLSDDDIKTQVELRLRTLGIRILTQQECDHTTSHPMLYVNVLVGRSRTGLYVSHISVQFKEVVVQLRPQCALVIGATTWDEGCLQASEAADFSKDTKDSLLEVVDKFANGYLAANPKK